MPQPAGKPPSGRRKLRLSFEALMLLLLACVLFCFSLSLRVHGRLHREHYDVAADDENEAYGNYRSEAGGRLRNADGRHHEHAKAGVSTGESKATDNIKSDGEGLSACLLVNDENPRLPEWLAYHYHVLPLRHLIVTVDPASRSSPVEILERWRLLMGLDYKVWKEGHYLPYADGTGLIRRGRCDQESNVGDQNDPNNQTDCLWRHRKRQRYFVKRCMADFQKRNLTWVLLVDVDEYITFNTMHDDDPPLPLDWAPDGVPVLTGWTKKEYNLVDRESGELVTDVHLEGTLSGLREEPWQDRYNGDRKHTGSIKHEMKDYFQGEHGVAYGNIVENELGTKYFLRDDFDFRDLVHMRSAPGGVATLKDARLDGSTLSGRIYNATWMGLGAKDGERIEVETNWREAPVDVKADFGGHLINTRDRKTLYVETDRAYWPPHLSVEESVSIRRRLPSVGDGVTVRDVLKREAENFGARAEEAIGPCLSMPRLLYGYNENRGVPSWKYMAPEPFDDSRFVTLRYRWHATKEARANKFGKTIVDVSRLRPGSLEGEAENIHVPLVGDCRRYPPRYSTSMFRVNHYLDSYEAYSYRNDARSSKRQCRECYKEKGKEAADQMDDDIRPWLKSFVDSIGTENAKILLEGAGNFAKLS